MKVICLLFFMWLSLGCSITKTLPQNSQTQNSQQDFHIDASQAFALITPSTTLELAEDKQALALTFEQVFHQQRPQLQLKSLANTLSDINTANLTETYRWLLVNHHQSGVFEQDALKNTLKFGRNYVRLDLRLSYKINSKKVTHEFALDLVNVTNRKNILKYSYTNAPPYNKQDYQLGFLPLFYYKLDF